jgi:hypothetical protein
MTFVDQKSTPQLIARFNLVDQMTVLTKKREGPGKVANDHPVSDMGQWGLVLLRH